MPNPILGLSVMSEGSGKAIKRQMLKILPKHFLAKPKVICDWGCGTGNFAKSFISQRHTVFALDQEEVVSKIPSGSKEFIAISDSTAINDQELDLIYALEVIEHIIDDEIETTFSNWRRILKKSGYLLLTTPNDENLEANSIVCPNCQTEFHSVQHVRTLSTSSISTLLELNGFLVEKVWLGEFFFNTGGKYWFEALRKSWFVIRRLQDRQKKGAKQPHMMVLCKLK